MSDEIAAASHQIGQAAFLSAVMNAAPFQGDPRVFGAVVFSAHVVASAHAILSLVALEKDEPSRAALLVKIHNDLMVAMKNVLMKHAPSGFSMAIKDGDLPPAPPPRFTT